MRNRLIVIALTASALVTVVNAAAQTQQPKVSTASKAQENTVVENRTLGEVMTVDARSKQLNLKATDGRLVIVALNDNTLYRRVPPGEINLDKAVSISFETIEIGDRVLARGKVDEKQQSFVARMVIVMSKGEVAEKHERDRAAWLKRGVAGVVTALNPEKKEITLRTGSGAGSNAVITATATQGATFRRYAPDSVKFRDAKLSSFAELKVGDQLRALGQNNADGSRYVAEEVVSATFRTTGGKITAVDQATGEVKITDAQTQKTITVIVISDSMLRRLSPDLVRLLQQIGSGPSPSDAAKARPSTGNQDDIQDRVEKSSVITLADLKPGDAILVSSITGADPSRVTAVLVAAGVEELVKRQMQQPSRPALNLGLGLPSGSLP